jgi:16S rRNA processing protein RimM
MYKKDFYFLGKITKTSGYKGNLMFFFDVDDITHYHDLGAVFIDIAGELIPFVITNLQFKNNRNAIVKLEDITSDEQAIALVGYELYLPLSFLPALSGNKFYFHEVNGFTVSDINYGIIGEIDHVFDQSGHAIFVIQGNGKEILIPVTDEFIKNVDRQKRTIEVETPPGLIEIYL